MALPATLYVLAIGVYPLLRGLVFSLYQLQPAAAEPHAFRRACRIIVDLIGDATMRQALANTAIFTVAAVAIQLAARRR